MTPRNGSTLLYVVMCNGLAALGVMLLARCSYWLTLLYCTVLYSLFVLFDPLLPGMGPFCSSAIFYSVELGT